MRWALSTVAPWVLSTALLVSFTATAGQPPFAPETLVRRVDPTMLSGVVLGPSVLSATSAFNLPALELEETLIPGRYETARYSLEEPQRLVPMNEYRPRQDLKRSAGAFPEVDRSRKSDPLIELRPSMSSLGGLSVDELLFQSDHNGLSSQFSNEAGEMQSQPQPLLPWSSAATPAYAGESDASPEARSLMTPGARDSLHAERTVSIDGSTPATPRALALSSATPAPADMTPVEISAAPVTQRADGAALSSLRATKGMTIARRNDEKPNYAALIDPEKLDKESRCLAEAVYFESRSEPEDGQAAVAQVVLNRVKSGLYPANICGVVYQNRHRYLGCQFTFACEGRALHVNEQDSWARAVRIAKSVLEGRTYNADVGASTHYHATYVRPWWARRLTKMDAIGRHVFYKLKPGQT